MQRQISAVALDLGVAPEVISGALGDRTDARARTVAHLLGITGEALQDRVGELVSEGMPVSDALDALVLSATR